uniref:Mab-21 domain-containing protein n=1 Tax=Glossina brevipalpis TaxID=37001 RepID=A0A1A9W333_9MUSC
MGRSSSKFWEKPHNPLQELQYQEMRRERSRLQQELEKKQIARLQKKQAKKCHKQHQQQQPARKQRKHNSNTSLKRNETFRKCSDLKKSNSGTKTHGDLYKSLYNQNEHISVNNNDKIEAKLQKQLNDDFCTFLLNQITFTMQFSKNYESEHSAAIDRLRATEKELNKNLLEHSVLLVNPLDSMVEKWIKYKPVHGPDKHYSQVLQRQTLYVVFENIDIARPNDANYDSISPLCKVNMECDFRATTPCKEDYIQTLDDIQWKGYVRLRLRENLNLQHIMEDIYTDGSSGYSTNSGYSNNSVLYGAINGEYMEKEYDYAYITHLNTHHPLKELRMTNTRERQQLDSKVLPESCISRLQNFVESFEADLTDEDEDDEESATEDEEEEEEDQQDSEQEYNDRCCYRNLDTLQAIKLYRLELERRKKLLAQHYLNSKEFTRYFCELLRKNLSKQLQIDEEELLSATYRGCSIYTNRYELIPAIHVAQNAQDWPKCAFEFRLRDRPVTINRQTGQQMQWPTRTMIKQIETFGFHVIPLGYTPKKKRNPFRDIEWQIVFPKAERYLEQHLTNAQVKVFMITKALFKSFVEPYEKNKPLMFALDHLRMHLFWECERDYYAWPEEFLGEVLLRFIQSFMKRLREKCLRDYFVSNRNLFESIPEYSLITLYSILADITANPLMHLMVALRNLQFAEDYFPKLNFKKLYNILIENDIIKLQKFSKHSRHLESLIDKKQQNGDNNELPKTMDEKAKGLVGLRQGREKTQGKLRRKTQILRYNIQMKKQELEAKRRSLESIDVEFFFSKNIVYPHRANQGLENLRKTNILEILLDQLLEMSEKSINYCSPARNILTLIRILCKFYHNYGCDLGAVEYLASLRNLEEAVQTVQLREELKLSLPSLPNRKNVETTVNDDQCSTKDNTTTTNSINYYDEIETKSGSNTTLGDYSPRNDDALKKAKRRTMEPKMSICFHNPQVQERSLEYSHDGRKSIKFNDMVIEVHQRDVPISSVRSDINEPVGILRPKSDITRENCTENKPFAEKSEVTPTSISPSNNPAKNTLIPPSLKSRMKLPQKLENSPLISNLTSTTEKFLQHMTIEEKKMYIREMLKRKTFQLKGAFNQSSDS